MRTSTFVHFLGVGLTEGRVHDLARSTGAPERSIAEVGAQDWLNEYFVDNKLAVACMALEERELEKHAARKFKYILVASFRVVSAPNVDGAPPPPHTVPDRPRADVWTRAVCKELLPGVQCKPLLIHATRDNILNAPQYVQDLYNVHSQGRSARPYDCPACDQTDYAPFYEARTMRRMLAERAVQDRPRERPEPTEGPRTRRPSRLSAPPVTSFAPPVARAQSPVSPAQPPVSRAADAPSISRVVRSVARVVRPPRASYMDKALPKVPAKKRVPRPSLLSSWAAAIVAQTSSIGSVGETSREDYFGKLV